MVDNILNCNNYNILIIPYARTPIAERMSIDIAVSCFVVTEGPKFLAEICLLKSRLPT
jgi:hypothetical protein